MKKLFSIFLSGLAIASTTLSFQSCADEYDPAIVTKHDLTVNQYTENFIKHYGEIDPNHTWGFGPIKGDAFTRVANTNKNEWADKFHLEVPGWPDIYYNEAGEKFNNGWHYGDNGNYGYNTSTTEPHGENPCGDVTDEEIQYVSWWFRTHRNPTSEIVHWTDFFIQDISSDNDRNADGTRDANLHEYEWDSNNKQWKYKKADKGNFTLDQLEVKTFDNSGSSDAVNSGFDHINNFNSGASNTLFSAPDVPMSSDEPWNQDGGPTIGDTSGRRVIMYYTSSGTEDFMAHYSNDQTWRNNSWVIKHLHFTGKSGRVYDGYYLGFDYEFYKAESEKIPADQVEEARSVMLSGQILPLGETEITADSPKKYEIREKDGYYSNWICKITPAKPHEESGYSRRVMCEDLGNTYDFDFNDVVFDVTYNFTPAGLQTYLANGGHGEVDATITIQAAGGTMPIYVGVNPNSRAVSTDYEAHALLGNATNTPVNVGAGASNAVAIYHLTLNSVDPADIPIYVDNNGQIYNINNHNLAGGNYTGSKDDDHQTIVHGSAKAPQSFCTPIFVQWMKECKFIETGYPDFKIWAQSEAACPEDSESAWFRNINESNKGNIYEYKPLPDSYLGSVINGGNSGGDNGGDKDYSEYGTKMTLNEGTEWGNKVYRLSTAEMTGSSNGKYLITVPCTIANQNKEINGSKLVKTKYVDWGNGNAGWESANSQDIMGSFSEIVNKDFTITFIVDLTNLGDYTHLKIENIIGTSDTVHGFYVKPYTE